MLQPLNTQRSSHVWPVFNGAGSVSFIDILFTTFKQYCVLGVCVVWIAECCRGSEVKSVERSLQITKQVNRLLKVLLAFTCTLCWFKVTAVHVLECCGTALVLRVPSRAQ